MIIVIDEPARVITFYVRLCDFLNSDVNTGTIAKTASTELYSSGTGTPLRHGSPVSTRGKAHHWKQPITIARVTPPTGIRRRHSSL